MAQCFSSQVENIYYYYYCVYCKNNIIYSVNAAKKRKKCFVNCEKCEKVNCITSVSQNYFVMLDLYYQLQVLFSNDNVFSNILENLKSENDSSFKGTIYKNITKDNSTNDKEVMLTFNCNTDGASLTKSGKRSFWPLQLL